jgi:hypothetical protein
VKRSGFVAKRYRFLRPSQPDVLREILNRNAVGIGKPVMNVRGDLDEPKTGGAERAWPTQPFAKRRVLRVRIPFDDDDLEGESIAVGQLDETPQARLRAPEQIAGIRGLWNREDHADLRRSVRVVPHHPLNLRRDRHRCRGPSPPRD